MLQLVTNLRQVQVLLAFSKNENKERKKDLTALLGEIFFSKIGEGGVIMKKLIAMILFGGLCTPLLADNLPNATHNLRNIGVGTHTGVIVIDNKIINSGNLKSERLSAEDKKKLQKALQQTQQEVEGLGSEIERDILSGMGDLDF